MTSNNKQLQFSWVSETKAQVLENLVKKHPELIPLCRDFALDYELEKAGKNQEDGLRKLSQEPRYITAICRSMTPEAFVAFTEALKGDAVVERLYLTTHRPRSLSGNPIGISHRLWTAIPFVDSREGHPDWFGNPGKRLLESFVRDDSGQANKIIGTLTVPAYGVMSTQSRYYDSHAEGTDIYPIYYRLK